MDSQQPKTSSSPFEYFLYAAIFAETALAALIYKAVFHSADLVQMRIYFAIFYFAFLAWAIWQLNKLHRNRKLAMADTAHMAEPQVPERALDPAQMADHAQMWERAQMTDHAQAVGPAQMADPAQVAEPAQQEDYAVEQNTHQVLGLTTAQLVIIVVVFATAVATFSWALRLLG
jgi:hypothetical protein